MTVLSTAVLDQRRFYTNFRVHTDIPRAAASRSHMVVPVAAVMMRLLRALCQALTEADLWCGRLEPGRAETLMPRAWTALGQLMALAALTLHAHMGQRACER